MAHRFLHLVLLAATIFMTPIGVYTCGSFASSIVLVDGEHLIGMPCDGLSVTSQTETAVSTYLTTPFLTVVETAVWPLVFFIFSHTFYCLSARLYKRKPPTPPPTLIF